MRACLSVCAFLILAAAVLLPAPGWAGIRCVTGLDANNNQVPCSDGGGYTPPGGGGGGGGYVPTTRDISMGSNNLGVAHHKAGRLLKAIELYKEALRIDPYNELAQKNLILAYVLLGNRYLDQNHLNSADAAFHDALNYDPNNAFALNGMGIVHKRRGNYAWAMDYYRQSLEADPNNNPALGNLVLLQDRLRREQERQEHNAKVDRFNELRDRANDLRGQAAVDLYLEALNLFPDDKGTWLLLALNQRIAGHFEDAMDSFRKAAELGYNFDLEKDLLQTRKRRDYHRVEQADGGDKVQALRDMLGRYPGEDARIRAKIAETLGEMGREDEMLAEYRKIIANAPRNSNEHGKALYEVKVRVQHNAYNLYNSGDYAAAEAGFRDFLSLDPYSSSNRSMLALSIAQQGREEEALALLQAAYEDYPDIFNVVYDLGWLLDKLGRYEEAQKVMLRAAELRPGDEKVKGMLFSLETKNSAFVRTVDPVFRKLEKWTSAINETAAGWGETISGMFEGEDAPATTKAAPQKSWTLAARETVDNWRETAKQAYQETFSGTEEGNKTTAPLNPSSTDQIRRIMAQMPAVPEPKLIGESYASVREKQWPELPQPAVKLGKEGIVLARDVWQRAKTETGELIDNEALDWVASKVRHGASLKSAIEKGKEVYKDYSKPVIDLYHHDMAGIQQGISGGDGDGFDAGSRKAGEALGEMSRDLTKKSVKWGIEGGVAPSGGGGDGPPDLKDKALSFVKKVFGIDENKITDVEKWLPPSS